MEFLLRYSSLHPSKRVFLEVMKRLGSYFCQFLRVWMGYSLASNSSTEQLISRRQKQRPLFRCIHVAAASLCVLPLFVVDPEEGRSSSAREEDNLLPTNRAWWWLR